MLVPIIDADYFCYSNAFASQHKDRETGELHIEPVHFCLSTVKKSITTILERYDVEKGDEGWWLYLSGKDNFRERVARIQKYKGNRTVEKPVHYQAVKDYLINHWGAIVVDGIEADDAVVMKAHEIGPRAVIAGQDKDYLQYPGKKYNPKTRAMFEVSEGEAIWNYWHQVLMGDRVDNILGIPGIGKRKASQRLSEALTLDLREGELPSHRAGLDVATEAYRAFYGHRGCTCEDGSVITWEEALHENMQLLYLLRSPEDSYRRLLE